MEISKERCYVLLSVKWTRQGSLMFWGSLTEDDKKRSFGGYTDDINACEKYTYEEVASRAWDFHKYNDERLNELKQIDSDGTWIVHIEDLSKLGRVVTKYVY